MKIGIVRQVGYLQRLYRDAARSTEDKIFIESFIQQIFSKLTL